MRESEVRAALLDMRKACARMENALAEGKGVEVPADDPTDATMPFGKYKGKRVSRLPADYCAWVLENMDIRSEVLAQALRAQAASE